MFPLPKSAVPSAAFPAVPATAAATMLAVAHQLRATQYLPPHELRALQFQQLGQLVAHARRAVPHYAESLRHIDPQPGRPITEEIWSTVPILTRRAVQEAGTALHARELPPGHGSVATATTSGSSGRPVTIRKTALAQFYWQCFALREHEWRARDLSAFWMTILRDNARTDPARSDPLRRLPNWGEPVSAVHHTGPAAFLDYRAEVAELLAILVREKPAYLTTFPSLLRELLRESRASGLRPEGLREVRSTGEALSGEVREWCAELWGAQVTESYTAADIGIIALPCPERNTLHVQSEGVLFELLRDDGAPCAPGEEGRVILTPLHNFAMPLLRYEIGDRAIAGPPCACGRCLPALAAIPGRARDMLSIPGGGRRFPFYGHNAIMRIDAIVQHQVAQTALDQVELRLVVRRPLTPAEEAHILASAREGLGPAHQPRIVYRDEIRRQASGKFAEFTNEYESAD